MTNGNTNNKTVKNDFVEKYQAVGELRFHKFLLSYAVNKLIKIEAGDIKSGSPELEFLTYSEKFLQLYRRENEEVFLEMSSVFRRTAHQIYWMMLKKGLTERNSKFLNLV
jgi:hypothetical protein